MTRLLSLKLESFFFFFCRTPDKKKYIDVCEGLKREDKGGELWGRMEVEVGFVAGSCERLNSASKRIS